MTENAEFLKAFPLLCRFLTHSTVYLEIFAFLIFLFPVPLIRCLGIFVMIGLHVGISLFMFVVGFNFSMVALLVLLMPPIFYDALERIGKSFFRNCSVVVRAIWERSRLYLRFLISSFVIVQIVLLCVDSTFTLCRGLGKVSKGKKHCPGLGDLRGVPNPLGKYSPLLREWLSVVHGGYQTHHPFAYVVFVT